MSLESILIWVAVGLIAGLLADAVVKRIRVGLLGSIIIGILGGFIGGYLFSLLGISIGNGFLAKVVSAFVGAVLLLLIMRIFSRRN